MEWTGTLYLCRRLPRSINIDRISFLRRTLTDDELLDPSLFEPLDEDIDNNNQLFNTSPVLPRKKTPIGFTYLVVARLIPMPPADVLRLLDFIYNMKLMRMKGYIAVYRQRKADCEFTRPLSQTSNTRSPTESPPYHNFYRQNTL